MREEKKDISEEKLLYGRVITHIKNPDALLSIVKYVEKLPENSRIIVFERVVKSITIELQELEIAMNWNRCVNYFYIFHRSVMQLAETMENPNNKYLSNSIEQILPVYFQIITYASNRICYKEYIKPIQKCLMNLAKSSPKIAKKILSQNKIGSYLKPEHICDVLTKYPAIIISLQSSNPTVFTFSPDELEGQIEKCIESFTKELEGYMSKVLYWHAENQQLNDYAILKLRIISKKNKKFLTNLFNTLCMKEGQPSASFLIKNLPLLIELVDKYDIIDQVFNESLTYCGDLYNLWDRFSKQLNELRNKQPAVFASALLSKEEATKILDSSVSYLLSISQITDVQRYFNNVVVLQKIMETQWRRYKTHHLYDFLLKDVASSIILGNLSYICDAYKNLISNVMLETQYRGDFLKFILFNMEIAKFVFERPEYFSLLSFSQRNSVVEKYPKIADSKEVNFSGFKFNDSDVKIPWEKLPSRDHWWFDSDYLYKKTTRKKISLAIERKHTGELVRIFENNSRATVDSFFSFFPCSLPLNKLNHYNCQVFMRALTDPKYMLEISKQIEVYSLLTKANLCCIANHYKNNQEILVAILQINNKFCCGDLFRSLLKLLDEDIYNKEINLLVEQLSKIVIDDGSKWQDLFEFLGAELNRVTIFLNLAASDISVRKILTPERIRKLKEKFKDSEKILRHIEYALYKHTTCTATSEAPHSAMFGPQAPKNPSGKQLDSSSAVEFKNEL